MKEQIKFNRTLYAVGRNGDIKQGGISIESHHNSNHIAIHPLTSKGDIANCLINIPVECLDDVIKKLIELRPSGNNENFQIYTIWGVDDVIGRYNDINGIYEGGEIDPDFTPITPAKAKQILLRIEKYHDASIGVNWDVIDTHTEMYLEGINNLSIPDPDKKSQWNGFSRHILTDDNNLLDFDVYGYDESQHNRTLIAKVRNYNIKWVVPEADLDFAVNEFITNEQKEINNFLSN